MLTNYWRNYTEIKTRITVEKLGRRFYFTATWNYTYNLRTGNINTSARRYCGRKKKERKEKTQGHKRYQRGGKR